MSDIQAGDLVVCVDVSDRPSWVAYLGRPGYAARALKLNATYRVYRTNLSPIGKLELTLFGVTNMDTNRGWAFDRFRKLLPDEPVPAEEDFTEFMRSMKPTREPVQS